jgi:hypothetical protein
VLFNTHFKATCTKPTEGKVKVLFILSL